MSRIFFITICCLMILLIKADVSSIAPGIAFSSNPYVNTQEHQNSQNTIQLKSPLLRKLISQLEPKDTNSGSINGIFGEQHAKSTVFLNSFLQHLETRRSQNQSSEGQTNRLELTINDGSSNVVNIEFAPNVFSDEQQKSWNSLVDLLADSIAFIVQEAERLGYNPNFKYSVLLSEIRPMIAYGPALSANALKSAVG